MVVRGRQKSILKQSQSSVMKSGDVFYPLSAGDTAYTLVIQQSGPSQPDVGEATQELPDIVGDASIGNIAKRTRSNLKREFAPPKCTPILISRLVDDGTASSTQFKRPRTPSRPTPPAIERADTYGLHAPKIAARELTHIRTIGTGSCGEVTVAAWKGTYVAVKKIFNSLLHKDAMLEFKQEAGLLARIRHPNIVLLLGTSPPSDKDYHIVTEYMARGSLRSVLDASDTDLPLELRLKMLLDAAQGMMYLHTLDPPIIHRDLKSHNLLADEHFLVKVTDFGLARLNPHRDSTRKTFCGTLPWCAPELFGKTGYTLSADVYSYAIVIWEVMTRLEPYAGLTRPRIIMGVTASGMRPDVTLVDAAFRPCPPGYTPVIQQTKALMSDCWDGRAESRPTFGTIVKRIQGLMELLKTPTSPAPLVTSATTAFTLRLPSGVERVSASRIRLEAEIVLEQKPDWLKYFTARLDTQPTMVIAKLLAQNADEIHRQAFQTEIDYLSNLPNATCPQLLGGVVDSSPAALLLEFMERGCLSDVLSQTSINWEVHSHHTFGLLMHQMFFKLAIDISTCLNTLHSLRSPLIHANICPSSFVVAGDVRLFDLSYARTVNSSRSAVPPPYTLHTAPEGLTSSPVISLAGDVFSLCIVLWEIAMKCTFGRRFWPYTDARSPLNVVPGIEQMRTRIINEGLRPTTSKLPPELVSVLVAGWKFDPSLRPNVTSILTELKRLRKGS